MTEVKQLPKFIDTSPCGKDLLESGSHTKIAKSIISQIKSGQSHSHLIGIDGTWGSGKSNVISIVQHELTESHYVFMYDAWSHQEDLQRRTFLEEFTQELFDKQLINETKWQQKLVDLLAKKKQTITKTIPRISPAYFFILAAIGLSPILATLAGGIDQKTHPLWKIFVVSIPALFLSLSWLIAACRNKEYRSFKKLLIIYKEKDLHKQVDEVISETEPSISEFRNWMVELGNDLKREVIVVFDNMDRLPGDKVKSLFSSIHTFFSGNKYKNIWVIVPFDKAHIQEAFENDLNKTDHFISKTFSVLYFVSPIVLTDWWKFFAEKFNDAFGQQEADEYNIVKTIFDRYQVEITPRKIISFINDLVALKQLWKNEIALRYLALFIINRDQIIKNPVDGILNRGYYTKVKFLFNEYENVEDKIAALVYNVPESVASQVTLHREILVAIRDKKTARLTELMEHREFYHILEDVFAREEIDIEPATFCISKIDEKAKTPPEKIIIENIWSSISGLQSITPVDDQVLTETMQILLLKANSYRRQGLIRHLLKQFSQSRNFKGAAYFKVLAELEIFVKDNKLDINYKEFITPVILDAENYIEFVMAAKTDHGKFSVSCNWQHIERLLVEKGRSSWEGSEILEYVNKEYSFPELKIEAERLIGLNEVTSTNFLKLIKIYEWLTISKPFTKILSDQKVNELLEGAANNSEEYFELVAMRLARGSKFTVNTGKSQTVFLLNEKEITNRVARRIEYYNDYGSLLVDLQVWEKPLLVAVLKDLTLNSHGQSRMSVNTILPLFDKISDTLGISDNDLFQRFDDWNSFVKLTPENIEQLIPGTRIYHPVRELDNELSKKIKIVTEQYLESIEAEKWKEIFKDEESYGFKRLCLTRQMEFQKGLPAKAVDQFKEHLLSLTDNNSPVANSESWQLLYNHSDKPQLKATVQNIRDLYINKVDITTEKFIFFEKALRGEGKLEDKSSDVVRKILTPVIDNTQCQQIMIENKEFYIPIIGKGGDESIDFIKKIRAISNSDQANEQLSSFVKNMNDMLAGKIKINRASYYSDKTSVDVTAIIKGVVEQEKKIHFQINNDLLHGDDLEPGSLKKLDLSYDYNGVLVTKTVNENEWLDLPIN